MDNYTVFPLNLVDTLVCFNIGPWSLAIQIAIAKETCSKALAGWLSFQPPPPAGHKLHDPPRMIAVDLGYER